MYSLKSIESTEEWKKNATTKIPIIFNLEEYKNYHDIDYKHAVGLSYQLCDPNGDNLNEALKEIGEDLLDIYFAVFEEKLVETVIFHQTSIFKGKVYFLCNGKLIQNKWAPYILKRIEKDAKKLGLKYITVQEQYEI
jgi:hypothetical protein